MAEARSLVERNDVALRDPDGQAFLQASSEAEAKAHTYELRKARRRQRLLGGVAGGAILFAIAAFVAAVMAFNAQQTADLARQELLVQRNAAQAAQQQAEQQANIATSRQLAAQAQNHLADRLDLAILLSIQAHRTMDTLEARSNLFKVLESIPANLTFLHATSSVTSVAFSPDGKLVVVGGADGTVGLWDLATPESRVLLKASPTGRVRTVAFSRDSKLVPATE